MFIDKVSAKKFEYLLYKSLGAIQQLVIPINSKPNPIKVYTPVSRNGALSPTKSTSNITKQKMKIKGNLCKTESQPNLRLIRKKP